MTNASIDIYVVDQLHVNGTKVLIVEVIMNIPDAFLKVSI
jgi:hypothetical protein